MRLDEPTGEGSEQRPDRWNRHGNENDPFLNLTPTEQNPDTVYSKILALIRVSLGA
jgi:hypothetical protein